MVNKIKIIKYKKLSNLDLEFGKRVTAISGANSTCKTSLLHIISNSFQAPTKSADWIVDKKCISIINSLNYMTNPKIETLNRGDVKYNDPARNVNGILLNVTYFNGIELGFRKHNSDIDNRYSIKPKYARGSGEKLPTLPVIYLGLSRLVPIGEVHNDSNIIRITKKLPDEYRNELSELYKQFTRYEIGSLSSSHLGDIKTRSTFETNIEGVDSNTISAGEDNLSIILTALLSLKYYFNSIDSRNDVESILLIDELDATLHPSYQLKLLNLLEKMAADYKIQIIFTTHSLFLMEKVIKHKDDFIYLIDNISSVKQMSNPTIYKIRMYLQNICANDIFSNVSIPVFTEDKEARLFIECLLDYYKKAHPKFATIAGSLHFVDACIGADILESIFLDFNLSQIKDRAICILDGDHDTNLNNLIISLPGMQSPENVILEYLKILYQSDNFWSIDKVEELGYSKQWYHENIVMACHDFEMDESEKKNRGESTKGDKRVFNKKLFNKYEDFFRLVFIYWINDSNNNNDVKKFFENFKIVYKRVCVYYQMDPEFWDFD